MSVRTRLLLLFFLITAGAVVFIYLYIVPQLSVRLTEERLTGLANRGELYTAQIDEALKRGESRRQLRERVVQIGQTTGSRVTILGVRTTGRPWFVVADSDVELSALRPSYTAAREAVRSVDTGTAVPPVVNTGIERIDNQRIGAAAFAGPARDGERPRYVTVFSGPLGEVDANVALIRRQVVISGTIAIIAALAAGWLAARAHSRRLRRLEAAAEKVAQGDFQNPIPVDSGDEVGQLAMTFNEMQKRLARLDGARREFIANASHELRTPIFSLGGFVELLEEEENDPDPAARAEFLAAMREQVDRLTKLTTDLLDLSKLDADAITVRRVAIHLDELGKFVAGEFRPGADRHGTRIDSSGLTDTGKAWGDPDRVTQILRILINNALAHTPEGTPVRLSCRRTADEVVLAVEDDGPGIDKAHVERLFDRFYTGDESGGSGLGLAIARELARRMGGRVTVANHRNPTVFELALPAA